MSVWKISPPNLSLARFELHLCTNSTIGIEQEIYGPCPCPQLYHAHAGEVLEEEGGITDNGRGFNPERLFTWYSPLRENEPTVRECVVRGEVVWGSSSFPHFYFTNS